MILSEYFHPLSPVFILFFILQIFFFDAVGTFFVSRIIPKAIEESRILNWFIGLVLFVFIWFIAGFFIPPQPKEVLISIIIIGALVLPPYIKNKRYHSFIKYPFKSIAPLLIIAAFLPAVYVKASLPPYYWDEMVYQFISPQALHNLTTWEFTGSLYGDIPKTLNTYYHLSFAVFKTYSIARLTHFSILVTAMLFAYREIRRRFGFLPAFLFVFVFFSLDNYIVLTSTLGYIDVATYSSHLIAMLFTLNFIHKRKKEDLFFMAAFWGVTLGIKYTPLTAVVSLLVPLSVLIIKSKNKFSYLLNRKTIISVIAIFIIFGGFWYVKNLVLFGNPIFPMVFPCLWGPAKAICGTSSELFAGWTTPVTISNLKVILSLLFPRNYPMAAAIAMAPVLALLSKKSERKTISLILITTIVIELVILKYFSGFLDRYHQHMQVMLILLLVLQIKNEYKIKILNIVTRLGFVVLFFWILFSYIVVVRFTNSLQFLNGYEVWYATRKVDIHDWVENKFPNTHEVIFWCQNHSPTNPVPLVQIDPDMIWYGYEGLLRVFLTGCRLSGAPVPNVNSTYSVEQAMADLQSQKSEFYLISLNECAPDEDVKTKVDNEGEHRLLMRQLNNKLVCKGQKLMDSLYYVNFNK